MSWKGSDFEAWPLFGGSMQANHSRKIEKISEWIGHYRGLTLDAVEQEIGTSPNWTHVRRRLLKIFGHHGLEEKIISVLLESGMDSSTCPRSEK